MVPDMTELAEEAFTNSNTSDPNNLESLRKHNQTHLKAELRIVTRSSSAKIKKRSTINSYAAGDTATAKPCDAVGINPENFFVDRPILFKCTVTLQLSPLKILRTERPQLFTSFGLKLPVIDDLDFTQLGNAEIVTISIENVASGTHKNNSSTFTYTEKSFVA